jgi:hypothetical protein
MRIFASFELLEQRCCLANDVFPLDNIEQSNQHQPEPSESLGVRVVRVLQPADFVWLLSNGAVVLENVSATNGPRAQVARPVTDLGPEKTFDNRETGNGDTVGGASCDEDVLGDAVPVGPTVQVLSNQPGHDTILGAQGEDTVHSAWHDVYISDTRARQHILKFAWDDSLAGAYGPDTLFGASASDISYGDGIRARR